MGSSQVISYRFSLDEVAVLREKALPGESDNQTAQRLMREILGLSTERSTETPKVSTSNLNERVESLEEKISSLSVNLEERIESIVEEKYSSLAGSLNDLLSRLQERLQALEGSQVDSVDSVDKTVESQPSEPTAVDTSVDSDVDESLTGKELAERLGVDPGTLTKNRSKPTFADWTRDKDPEGTAWQYLSKVKRYRRLLSTEMSTPASTAESDHLAGWKAKVDEVVGAL